MAGLFGSLFGNKQAKEEARRREETARYQQQIEQNAFSKYGASWNIVNNYDGLMARSIARENVPQYAVDWLAESIKSGREIESKYVFDSIRRKLPYLCETELEMEALGADESPLQDIVTGIDKIIFSYTYSSDYGPHPQKKEYWINRLAQLAAGGNYMAQAALCWSCGMLINGEQYRGVITRDEWERYVNKYEQNLLAAYHAGNPHAQLAAAYYYRKLSYTEKELLYADLVDRGFTDACYYYARILMFPSPMNDSTVRNKWHEMDHPEWQLFKLGAERDNGVMAGCCQCQLAYMYDNGDGVPEDSAAAQRWYRRAADNGCIKELWYPHHK